MKSTRRWIINNKDPIINFIHFALAFIFAETQLMEQRKSTSKYWMLMFFWIGVLILLIVFYPELLWISFPGIFTNFVLALNLMDLN